MLRVDRPVEHVSSHVAAVHIRGEKARGGRCTNCAVTCFPRAVTSGSERKFLTTERGRGVAASLLELLQKIHGSVFAVSVPAFTTSQTAVAAASAANSQSCVVRAAASAAIMSHAVTNRARLDECELCRQKGVSVYKDRMPADGPHIRASVPHASFRFRRLITAHSRSVLISCFRGPPLVSVIDPLCNLILYPLPNSGTAAGLRRSRRDTQDGARSSGSSPTSRPASPRERRPRARPRSSPPTRRATRRG